MAPLQNASADMKTARTRIAIIPNPARSIAGIVKMSNEKPFGKGGFL
jgi:hypothetical protein